MHKIQKYQVPTSRGIQFNPMSPAESYTQSITDYFGKGLMSGLKLRQNTGLVPMMQSKGLEKVTSSIGNSTSNPQISQLFGKDLKLGPASGSSKGFLGGFSKEQKGDLIGKAADLVGMGLEAAGVKKAETMGAGEQGIMTGLDTVGKTLVKSGGPAAIVGGAMLAAKAANEYGGQKNAIQGTADIGTTGRLGGYTADVSLNAGKKNSAFGTHGVSVLLGPEAIALSKTKWGKKLFGKSKQDYTNEMTARADKSNLLKSRAGFESNRNLLVASNTAQDIGAQNQQKLIGGLNQNILSAKRGAKINPKKLSNIKKKAQYKVKKVQEGSDIDDGQKMALGGKINVIPEGALHAHKNNYDGDLGGQVTNKGIPVITYEDDGKIVQHAEIEKNEVIFNIETTKQLEKWFKEYNDTDKSSDKTELEIKCGKFLTQEILENTIDNTQLLLE